MSSVKEIVTANYTLNLDPLSCRAGVYINTIAFEKARLLAPERYEKLFAIYDRPGKESELTRGFTVREDDLKEFLVEKNDPAMQDVDNEETDDDECDDEEVKGQKEFVMKYLPEIYQDIMNKFSDFADDCIKQVKDGKMDFTSLAWMLSSCSSRTNEYTKTNLVLTNINGVEMVAKLHHTRERASMFGARWLELELNFLWLRGTQIKTSETAIKIPEYEGKKTLEELGIVFIAEENLNKFAERGQQIVKTAKQHLFKNFEGNIYIPRGYMGTVKLFTKTRMVVDGQICYEENKLQDLHSDDCHFLDLEEATLEEIENRDLARLSPFLPGFDLKNKRWGYVNIEGLSDIVFRKDALSKLVINEDDKSLLSSIAEIEHLESKDVIDGKGGGAIFLLTGTPGVGKTLTAEAIAETQEKPLYMVSVGELGTDVSNLEDSMKSILAVAEKWNAILLIDEVDIFLEQRDSNNIERNAMVGVFLRTLEYYAGILFLTTNRVKNLDQAFYSRVSLCLHYKDLDHETRKKIFENQLQLYCIQNLVNLDDIIRFCDSNDIRINGRQIKNTVRIAHAIATQQKRTVETKDFHRVLGKIKEFDRTIDK